MAMNYRKYLRKLTMWFCHCTMHERIENVEFVVEL